LKTISLDSHVFLWWLSDKSRLGDSTKSLISSADAVISVMALFELAQKQRINKLDPRVDFFKEAEREEFEIVDFGANAARTYRKMPELDWRDPFDHMIMAHSVSGRQTLLTADRKILSCGWSQLDTTDASM